MALLNLVQAATTAYQQRDRIKKILISTLILIAGFLFFIYLAFATVVAVIQGGGNVSEGQHENITPFTEFQQFSYKTIYGEKWYEFKHLYIFPTLGVLTQGVILDSSAKVGQRHIAWDIADRKSRDTQVKAFADGKVISIKDNILHNTTRRWRFCDENESGICWYAVKETADVQIGCGHEVTIEHADSLRTQYCHLISEPAFNMGDHVTMGQTLGYQGSTGYATGKHLHFVLSRNGQPIDPSYAFSQTSLSDWNSDN